MAIYIYDYHDERGEFHAYVRDEAGNIVWEVHYPEYLEDDESGELLEASTIFEDGYLKNADDLEGLYYYLRDFGAIEEDDEVIKQEDYEKREDAKDNLLEFTIPNWAMSAIVNGDTSGLRDDDIEKIDSFESRLVELYGNANLMLGDVDGEDDLGFCYRNDIDGNLGADCSRMYLRPSKKYHDGGALMDGQYGFGTSYLAKGGSLEDRIKKRLGENFELPIELAVYVPSTEKANQVVSKRDYASRIDEVRSYLANLFGGYSSEGIDGGYVSDEKGLIQEDVTKVTAFATKENFEQKLESLITQIKKWCAQWGQESIGFEFEGDLFYIDKGGKFVDGGSIPAGYHMMPDGTIMPDSAHFDDGGEVDDDEDDKEQEHLEYISEETNIPIDVLKEYASNKGIDILELDTDLGYQGSYDDEEAFAQYCVDEGLLSNLSYYLEMYDTDKRILIDEMSDNYVDDLSDDEILELSSYSSDVEDLRQKLDTKEDIDDEIEGLKDQKEELIDSQDIESMTESDREDMDRALQEFDEKIEELENERDNIESQSDIEDEIESLIEKAKDEVRAIYYDELQDRLDKDAVGYFVDELGYDEKDLVDKNGFFIDLGLVARDLGHDYDFIEYAGEVYVFSSYYKWGGNVDLGASFDKFKKTLNIIPNEVQSQIKDNEVLNMAMESVGDAWEDLTDAERELIVNSFREGYKKGNYAKGGKFEVDPTYTHFAVGKKDGKIVTGWEYKDLDKESIKYYTKVDLVDMDFKPSDFRILTAKYLKAQGVDPFNWDNWRKHGDNYYAHGGSVEEGNLEMLKNQAHELKHHANELEEVLKKKPRADAWTVAKMERATSDASDVTHYFDGLAHDEHQQEHHQEGLKKDFLEDVGELHDEIESITLKDNSVISHDELMEAHEGQNKYDDGGVTPTVFEKVKITIRDVDMGGDVIYKNDHWINKKALDEKSSSDIGKYILNKYGLDYGNTYKFSLKRTGETREKDKKSIGGFIAGVAVGAIGSKLLSNDKKETPKSNVEEKEMTWQEELKMYDDKEGFDYAINEYSSDIKDKKFIDLKNKYIRESNKIKKYIDSKEEIYDSKYDITVQDAVDKEGIDYALMGYNDWKGVKDKKFQDLLKEYLQSRKALSKYIGIGTQMARGGELIEKINNKIKEDRGYVDYAEINGVIKNVKYKNEYGEGYKEHKNVPIINALNLGEKMGLFKEVKDKRKPYKKQGYWLNVEDYARGGELLSDVDMYVKIHGYYPMEVMALRGEGIGQAIVRNEAHNFELSGVDSRKAEEMGYEFDYDKKGWVEVEEDDDDFAKGGSIDDLDEIKKGDYVNFGEYGNFYVVDTDYLIDGTHFWVTRDKENRTNSQAPGYTILKGDAQYIIEKYSNDDDYAKGGKTKWIQEAIQKPGALRETAKRKGLIEGEEKLSKTDLKKLEKVGGKTGQRARLAATLKGLGKKKKMAKGGQTKFISLTTRKGQSEVEKYTNQGWGIKFQNDKFAILERGGKKKN